MTSPEQESLFKKQGPVVPQEVDHRALSVRLYKALKKVLEHEGCGRWTQAPYLRSTRLGCQFCGLDWAEHDPECLYLKASKFLTSVEPYFKQD